MPDSAKDILEKTSTTIEPIPGVRYPIGNTSASNWLTGDYKMSAQAADHADPSGGSWLICDGTANPASATALITLIGANRPDAQGRTLVMKGSHADVSTVLNSDGLAVASRRPKHKHTVSVSIDSDGGNGGTFSALMAQLTGATRLKTTTTNTPISATVGPQTGAEPTDTPAYLVPGSLFIHT